MSKLHVAVLRGGPSSQYDLSLQTGSAVLRHMPEKYQAHDIFISKDGIWHREGFERTPDRALSHIDVVFNALHGEYGEDGKVQKILDTLGIPYTGSGAVASSLGSNKILTKKIFGNHNIKTPYFTVVKKEDDIKEKVNDLFHHFFLPIIVKPATGGDAIGISIVENFADLEQALEEALAYSDAALVEEYINGKEATVGIIENFRDQDLYTLLPVEISRANNRTQHIIPSTFTESIKHELQALARYIHHTLGLKHYSHSDFIVSPRRGIFVLEVNTLPSLHQEAMLPKSLEAIGFTLPDFLDHVIVQAYTPPSYS